MNVSEARTLVRFDMQEMHIIAPCYSASNMPLQLHFDNMTLPTVQLQSLNARGIGPAVAC